MPLASPILQTVLPNRSPDFQGKVRDVYRFGDRLLIVATDRLSAFDYILASGIPDKGRVLTQISEFWFHRTQSVVPNHLLSTHPDEYPRDVQSAAALLNGRSMLVRRTEPLALECVARGYLAGSAWKEYRTTGRVCGISLPAGLREADRLPSPIFTPATKAQSGHDINISEQEGADLVGPTALARVRDLSLRLYAESAAYAEARGIIVADTKFEFGWLPSDGRPNDERLILIDEALTPDSSRFWPMEGYRPGAPQPSFDKQFVRDYLEQIGWDKKPPVPGLPDDVILKTREKYLEAFRRLTGRELDGPQNNAETQVKR